MLLFFIIFCALISLFGYAEGSFEQNKNLKLHLCIEEIQNQNQYLQNLTLIEFKHQENKSIQYDEYLKIYNLLERDLTKYNCIKFEELNKERQDEYLHLLRCLSVCCGKLASTASIFNALSFAKKSKEYGELYLSKKEHAGIYITLAALYLKVPPYPIAFGNKQKAKEYFNKHIEICTKDPKSCLNFVFHGKYIEFLQNTGVSSHQIEAVKQEGMQIEPQNCEETLKKMIFEKQIKSSSVK